MAFSVIIINTNVLINSGNSVLTKYGSEEAKVKKKKKNTFVLTLVS